MPGSPTGSNPRRARRGPAGFTLVESLLAIVILAVGALAVLPAFHRSADYLTHLHRRHDAETVLNNLIARADRKFKAERRLGDFATEGEVTQNGVVYRYAIEAEPLGGTGTILELRVTVNWLGEGTSGITRAAYVTL